MGISLYWHGSEPELLIIKLTMVMHTVIYRKDSRREDLGLKVWENPPAVAELLM